MPDDIHLKCRLCGKSVPVKEMRYHRSGQYLICRECADKQSGILKTGTTHLEKGKTLITKPEVKKERKELKEIVNYKCSACNYRFSRKASFESISCPYCGSENVNISTGDSAQELINEASEEEDF